MRVKNRYPVRISEFAVCKSSAVVYGEILRIHGDQPIQNRTGQVLKYLLILSPGKQAKVQNQLDSSQDMDSMGTHRHSCGWEKGIGCSVQNLIARHAEDVPGEAHRVGEREVIRR